MAKKTDLDFWGFEELEKNNYFSVTMDADKPTLTIFFHKTNPCGYDIQLNLSYNEWIQFYSLINSYNVENQDNKSKNKFGSIEYISNKEIALSIGSLTIYIPKNHFVKLQELINKAEKKIVKF